jgi:hypothetical protein
MSEETTERDVQIRAAIDEYHQAIAEQDRIREETTRWQQEHPPPQKPETVTSVAQIDEYERKNEEWGVPYREQLRMRDEAAVRAEKATETLTTLLPRDYGYVYKGHRYLVPSDTGKLGVSKKL